MHCFFVKRATLKIFCHGRSQTLTNFLSKKESAHGISENRLNYRLEQCFSSSTCKQFFQPPLHLPTSSLTNMIKSTTGDTSNCSGEPQVSLTESLDLDIQGRHQILPDGVRGIGAEINRAFVSVHTLARGILRILFRHKTLAALALMKIRLSSANRK